MAHYRKKLMIIEAVRFIGDGTPPEIEGPEPLWYAVARTLDRTTLGSIAFWDGSLAIHTLEGIMQANRGDWVLLGIAGEIYPCKDAIFRASYDPVEPPPL